MPHSEHLNPHDGRRDYHGVYAIDPYRVEWVQPKKWLTFLTTEGHVVAHLFKCPTGLDPANDIPMRELLVFEADDSSSVYPKLAQPP
jgi:hypothetical protein